MVVGCGPTGAVVAALLARAGHRVTAIDRDHGPNEGILIVTPPAREVLDELGWGPLLDATGTAVEADVLAVSGAHDRVELPVRWLAVPRPAAVAELASAAVRQGVTLISGYEAVAPIWEERRVVGVRARDRDGVDHELLARIVVDASGREALLPHLLGHVLPRQGPRRVRALARGGPVEKSVTQLAVVDRQWLLAAPLEGGPVSAVLRRTSVPGREDLSGLESDLQRLVGDRWKEPVLDRSLGVVGLHLRSHAGEGWVAVGEAGGCGGPGLPSVTSTGIARAASAAWEIDLGLRSGRQLGSGELGATVALGRQTVFFDSYLERVLARVAAVGELGRAVARTDAADHLAALLGGEWAARRGRLRRLLLLWRIDRRARRELRRRRKA